MKLRTSFTCGKTENNPDCCSANQTIPDMKIDNNGVHFFGFFYFMVAFGPSTYFFKYIINVVSYYLNIKVQSMDVIHGNDNNHNNLARQTIA